MLSLDKITVRFDETVALSDVSMAVKGGELVALLGFNGAGKSTLLRVIAGLTRPDSGRVIAPQLIGWCPQEHCLWNDLTCHEHIYLVALILGMNRAEASNCSRTLLRSHSLEDRAHALVRTLSGGMKRRLSLAISQINRPLLIILDEPSAGLDLEGQRFLRSRALELAKNGTSVLLATHDYEDLETLASRVVILQNGVITSDATPRALVGSIDGLARIQIRSHQPESYEGLQKLGPSTITSSSVEVETTNLAEALDIISQEIARSGEPESIRIEKVGLSALVSGERPGLIVQHEPDTSSQSVYPRRPRLIPLLSLLARRQSRDRISLALTFLTPAFFALFFNLVIQDEAAFQSFLPRLGVFSALMLIFSTALSVAREFEAATVDRLRLAGVRAHSYFTAVLITQTGTGLLGLVILAAVGIALGFNPHGLALEYGKILALTALICSSIGVAVASLARDVPRSFVFASTTMFLLMLFSGIIFPLPDVAILWPIATRHATLALDALGTDHNIWAQEFRITLSLGIGYLLLSYAAFRPRWVLNHQPRGGS